MRHRIVAALTSTALAVLMVGAMGLTTPAGAANNSEQLVFSGTGFSGAGPFGNWVWCEADSTNPYAGFCSGSMYFYGLHLTKHVNGFVTENPPDSGLYQVFVASADNSVRCELSNPNTAVRGPHNTVNLFCLSPNTSGSSSSEVVNVTGP
jgi:hypothetical protein